MSIEIENLLKKRFKVIADFPLSVHAVGEVLIPESDNCIKCVVEGGYWATNLSKYPHLFKELAWYEEIDEEDIQKVKYLKHIHNISYVPGEPEILEVRNHFKLDNSANNLQNRNRFYFTSVNGRSVNYHYSGFAPVDEQEYITSKETLLL